MITDENELRNIDLERTICPPNLKVEIEGHPPRGVRIPNICLAAGINHVFVLITNQYAGDMESFARRITLLALDPEKQYVRVRVADK